MDAGISVVMIGRTAAATVGEALRAAAPVADEIVFADTGSTDATRAIAAAAGCRVLDVPWTDDFAAARNAAIAHARFRWIFTIDTDEILQGPAARAVIEQAVARAPAAPAFLVAQDNVQADGAIKPNPVARLFWNHPQIRYRNPVHECVSEAVLEHWPAQRLALLDVHLVHRGYLPGHAAGKHARNLAILERWVAAEPGNAFGQLKLGSTLWDLGRRAEALAPLDAAYRLLSAPAARKHAAYLPIFLVIYHRALQAERGAAAAAGFERVADAWLAE